MARQPCHPTDGLTPALDPLAPETNAQHRALLEKIQGNILKSHGRKFVKLVLFRFECDVSDKIELRALLSDVVSPDNKDKVGTAWGLTSAYQQCADAQVKATDPHRPFYGLGLTVDGLRRCGYRDEELPIKGLGPRPLFTGFGSPMNYPDTPRQLGDEVGTKANPLPTWEATYRDGVDGVFILGHDDAVQLAAMERRVTDFIEARHAAVIGVENGFGWTDSAGDAREPFGFKDGVSDPIFFDKDCYHDPADPATPWVPKWVNIPRRQVLIDGSAHEGGSFLVLRKIEQNVRAFRALEEKIQTVVDTRWPATDPTPRPRPKTAGALLIGRERDGDPLAELTAPPDAALERLGPNRFDFQGDASRCPFHAHIRKCAPRVDVAELPPALRPDPETEGAIKALFVRRSAVYDTYGQLPPDGALTDGIPDAPYDAATYRTPAGLVPTGDVGLLFMGYMSNIDAQFVKLQMTWFLRAGFPFKGKEGMIDATIQYKDSAARPLTWHWPTLGPDEVPLAQTTTSKGGAYFYVPALTWLKAQKPPATIPNYINSVALRSGPTAAVIY